MCLKQSSAIDNDEDDDKFGGSFDPCKLLNRYSKCPFVSIWGSGLLPVFAGKTPIFGDDKSATT